MTNNFLINITAFTHQGKVRENNEDCILVDDWICQQPMEDIQAFSYILDDSTLCMVADGLGGHAAGEIASAFVIQRFQQEKLYLSGHKEINTLIHKVNQEIHQQAIENKKLADMGTTIVGLYIDREKVLGFNVGDSRLYRYYNNILEQISIDDNTPPQQIYGLFYTKGYLTQCIGGHKIYTPIQAHFFDLPLSPATYLLCSDGLSDLLSKEEIQQILNDDIEYSAKLLYLKAMQKGGVDNISIIIIKVSEVS